jgi:hypothetical protein
MQPQSSARAWFAAMVLLLAAVLAGCVPVPPAPSTPGASPAVTLQSSSVPAVTAAATTTAGVETPQAQPAPTDWEQVLKNLEYRSTFTASGTASLVNGEYREPAAPGSASETVVTLTGPVATGDLNGDGVPDAVAVLATSTGGSGTFVDLAAVVMQDGKPVNVATAPLGDRVQVNSVSVTDGTITVDMITQGPNDPMCCPTQHVQETYQLQGDQLVETSSRIVSE